MSEKMHSSPSAQTTLFLVANQSLRPNATVSKVADILEREAASTMSSWVLRVRSAPQLFAVHLHQGNLCAHLPGLFRDLITRLRSSHSMNSHTRLSVSAAEYGCVRLQQGYSAAMMVEESRLLLISIIDTLQKHVDKLDMDRLLVDVATIADELDAQLAESIASYIWQSQCGLSPSAE